MNPREYAVVAIAAELVLDTPSFLGGDRSEFLSVGACMRGQDHFARSSESLEADGEQVAGPLFDRERPSVSMTECRRQRCIPCRGR